MKKRYWKKLGSFLLIGTMLAGVLVNTGCGDSEKSMQTESTAGEKQDNDKAEIEAEPDTTGDADEMSETNAEKADTEDTSSKSKAMGRYVETENDFLKETIRSGGKLTRMSDDSLVIFTRSEGKWVSKDNGETWEPENLAWYEELKAENAYIMSVAVSRDGYVGIIYEDGIMYEEDAGGAETESEAAESESETEEYSGLHPKYRIVTPEGAFVDVEIPHEEKKYLENFHFSEDGRLFGAALGGMVYEINREDGSYKELFELSDWVYEMEVKGNLLACMNTEGITFYDLEKEEIIEDEVLDDFVGELFERGLGSGDIYTTPIVLLLEDENILYMVMEDGIFRHVVGGSAVEQLADGALLSLSNPSFSMCDGVLEEGNVFMILYGDGVLRTYRYDEKVPTVPDIQLKAYSLVENETLKLAISTYQAEHPEVYIRYETGMSGTDSTTREDALKKLNTEIVAGSGPDIFVLDNMPVEAYMEKGVLLDLSPYLEKMPEEEYFRNVLEACQTESGIYAVPAQFSLPVIAGSEDTIRKGTDLAGLADAMEAGRTEQAEGNILGVMTEEELLSMLIPVGAPAWKKDGQIDEAALQEFFRTAKRIWNAENAGITEEMRTAYEQEMVQMMSWGMTEADIQAWQFSLDGQLLDYLSGKQRIAIGSLESSWELDMMLSSFRIEGKKDSAYGICKAQGKGVFIPEMLLGISATSKYPDIAGELLQRALDGEAWDGFPVGKEKCREELLINFNEEGSQYGGMSVMDENGTALSLDIYPSSKEEVEHLMRQAESAAMPYVKDSVLEDAVREAGSRVLAGEMSEEDGVAAVQKKVAIYMAE